MRRSLMLLSWLCVLVLVLPAAHAQEASPGLLDTVYSTERFEIGLPSGWTVDDSDAPGIYRLVFGEIVFDSFPAQDSVVVTVEVFSTGYMLRFDGQPILDVWRMVHQSDFLVDKSTLHEVPLQNGSEAAVIDRVIVSEEETFLTRMYLLRTPENMMVGFYASLNPELWETTAPTLLAMLESLRVIPPEMIDSAEIPDPLSMISGEPLELSESLEPRMDTLPHLRYPAGWEVIDRSDAAIANLVFYESQEVLEPDQITVEVYIETIFAISKTHETREEIMGMPLIDAIYNGVVLLFYEEAVIAPPQLIDPNTAVMAGYTGEMDALRYTVVFLRHQGDHLIYIIATMNDEDAARFVPTLYAMLQSMEY